MKDQDPATWPPFELLETILFEPNSGFYLLERHFKRLFNSAEYFKNVTNGKLFSHLPTKAELECALKERVPCDEGGQRIRLLLASSGAFTIEYSPLPQSSHLPLTIALDSLPTSSTPFQQHKTTYRKVYTDARSRVGCNQPSSPIFDVLMWNDRGEITETSIANVAVEIEKGGLWVTPYVECGLLAGVYRSELLEEGKIVQGIVTIEDVKRAAREDRKIRCFNSVRKEYEVVLIDASTN